MGARTRAYNSVLFLCQRDGLVVVYNPGIRMEGIEPSWPKPPVSEAGASTSVRHIRTKSRAGARLAVSSVMRPAAAGAAGDRVRRRAAPGGAPRAARPSPGEPVRDAPSAHGGDGDASRLLSLGWAHAAPSSQRAPRAWSMKQARQVSNPDQRGWSSRCSPLHHGPVVRSLRQESNLRFNRTKGACCP